jgi:hypothetical protein
VGIRGLMDILLWRLIVLNLLFMKPINGRNRLGVLMLCLGQKDLGNVMGDMFMIKKQKRHNLIRRIVPLVVKRDNGFLIKLLLPL